ncbi:MAG: isochorismatase family protein [Proteobacteria bacterium]|nr:isochorismatase family protein [Pseudomonadota bacterium]
MKTNNERHLTSETTNLFDPRSAGLLVVDVQERLWPFIHDKTKIGRRVIQAIEVAGHLELPILVTEQYVKGLGPTLPEIIEQLSRFNAYRPMEKFAFSCFGDLDFEETFESSGIDTLAIVGIEAHVCVMQTALDALDRGIDVFLIAEAIGSRDSLHKEEAICRVRDAGAIVGSVEMFAFEAMRTSKHPAFRNVQKVIV